MNLLDCIATLNLGLGYYTINKIFGINQLRLFYFVLFSNQFSNRIWIEIMTVVNLVMMLDLIRI